MCDSIQKRKPRDPTLLSLLREFLYVAVTKKFFPIVRKIGTQENKVAYFISWRFDPLASKKVFSESGLHYMELVKPSSSMFNLSANW